MDEKLPATAQPWSDPDDAPELTDEFFDKGVWMVGDQEVLRSEGEAALSKAIRRGRPRSGDNKVLLSVRYSQDVVAYFRSTGAGWQTRMDEALRVWIKAHPLT